MHRSSGVLHPRRNQSCVVAACEQPLQKGGYCIEHSLSCVQTTLHESRVAQEQLRCSTILNTSMDALFRATSEENARNLLKEAIEKLCDAPISLHHMNSAEKFSLCNGTLYASLGDEVYATAILQHRLSPEAIRSIQKLVELADVTCTRLRTIQNLNRSHQKTKGLEPTNVLSVVETASCRAPSDSL